MKYWIVKPCSELLGEVTVPGDKSVGHRAVLFAALGNEPVRVVGLSDGQDNRRTVEAIKKLGVAIEPAGGDLIITGRGVDGLQPPASDIDCGNSGTSMRLLAGVLAGQHFASTMVGDDSLTKRPMRRIVDPLRKMGATVDGANRNGQVYPPLDIRGVSSGKRLQGIDYDMPMASAQVKSCILLAGLYADGITRVREPGPSRDHTERMLCALGVPIRVPTPGTVEFDPSGWDRQISAERIEVYGDPSSAAFLTVAAGIVDRADVRLNAVCANTTRTGYLEVLQAMHARIDCTDTTDEMSLEPRNDIHIRQGGGDGLTSTRVEGALTVRAIDELPVLAVAAARAEGETVFADAGELRVKESDRIATTVAMLNALGVETQESVDGFRVQGDPGTRLRATRIDAAGDHRIAMAAAVAALVADGDVRIDNTDNVATSFPTFIPLLSQLGASIEECTE